MTLRTALLGLAFVFMWSSAFTSARVAVADAPPFLILTARFAVSGGLAILIATALGQKISLDRAGWRAVVLFGLFQNALYLGLNFVAVQWIEAGLASIIASALPLSVAAAQLIFGGQRLPLLGVAGLAAGLSGVLLIMSARISGGADPLGVLLCIIGLLSLTAATLLVSGASARGNLLMVVGLQMLVGSAALLPVSLLLEDWVVNWTWSLGIAFTYTTLVPGLAATLVWFVLVGQIGATRAASFHFLNPFFGVAIAALILGEGLSLRDVIGVVVIMAGIYMVQRARA
ncbi:DMT family transporter [Halovulum dunhuangense]|uniref:DMT family transporter n=1 Tax=Halovulum dunhuangense TaxID=1505036 RepID=A0A849KZ09_9RHOB|nr:DMT family transporter [Halovulum dunhuangense]NNU79132.1 DMT family transporter [Halovulum dunhuangense]